MLDKPASIAIARSANPAFDGDDPERAFSLLADGARRGLAGALITIVGIEGGAPRALGAHMAVLADGTFCGYVSGGCVEAAVAGEALKVLRGGQDAVLRFGRGSPFMDIQLPCGGGIDVHVHVAPSEALIDQALAALISRRAVTIAFSPGSNSVRLTTALDPHAASGWHGDVFHRSYLPRTQLVLIGRSLEFETLLAMGKAAGFALSAFTPDEHAIRLAEGVGIPATLLAGLSARPMLPVDPWTAIVFLFHDHEWEAALLPPALESDAFFVGALGSRNTHAARCARLREQGLSEAALARIKGPIGMFGPTRSAASLAVSVLAQIVEERRAFDLQ